MQRVLLAFFSAIAAIFVSASAANATLTTFKLDFNASNFHEYGSSATAPVDPVTGSLTFSLNTNQIYTHWTSPLTVNSTNLPNMPVVPGMSGFATGPASAGAGYTRLVIQIGDLTPHFLSVWLNNLPLGLMASGAAPSTFSSSFTGDDAVTYRLSGPVSGPGLTQWQSVTGDFTLTKIPTPPGTVTSYVPEMSTWLMMLFGLGFLGVKLRRARPALSGSLRAA